MMLLLHAVFAYNENKPQFPITHNLVGWKNVPGGYFEFSFAKKERKKHQDDDDDGEWKLF
jgi:hypothetical protein